MVFFDRFLVDFWMILWWTPKAMTLDPLENFRVDRRLRHLLHIMKFIGKCLNISWKFIAKSMKNQWKNVWIFGQICWLIFGGFLGGFWKPFWLSKSNKNQWKIGCLLEFWFWKDFGKVLGGQNHRFSQFKSFDFHFKSFDFQFKSGNFWSCEEKGPKSKWGIPIWQQLLEPRPRGRVGKGLTLPRDWDKRLL